MLMHKINTNIKSIDVFKNHPSNKITISNGGKPNCGEFEIMRSWPKARFCVNGSGKYEVARYIWVS